MASKKQNLKQKVKKKWFSIYAPKVFNNVLIGETYIDSVDKLKGKYINANLATIIGDMKKQNVSVTLRVHKVLEGKGHTEVIGMRILQGHLKRLVRRGRTKVEDSFTVKTKDDVLVRIKPLVITSNNCKRAAASEVRAQVKAIVSESLSSNTFAKNVHDILTFKMQKGLKAALAKIVPIRTVDIRVFEREPIRGKVPEVELSEEIPADEAPKKKPVKKAAEKKPVEDEDADEAEEESSEEESEDDKTEADDEVSDDEDDDSSEEESEEKPSKE